MHRTANALGAQRDGAIQRPVEVSPPRLPNLGVIAERIGEH
jgi:hypothetical protein